jgi:succinate-semialdehyde dehydrogenase/glutarate-semialdehyde dehydrogenase
VPFATTNPYTGEVVKAFPAASNDDIKAAIAKADTTFEGWRETGAKATRSSKLPNDIH